MRMRLGGYNYGAMGLRRALRPAIRTIRYVGLRPSDVLLASYPKSGSTWLRFMLVELLTGRDPEWAFVTDTVPYVGEHRRMAPTLPAGGRLLYTHDRATGRAGRAVYLVRDVRDVVLSEHRWIERGGTHLDLSGFVTDFVGGKSHLFGSWADHVRYWLDSRIAKEGNLLVVTFEDLRAEPAARLAEIARFVGLDPSDAEIERAVDDNSLQRMQAKEGRAPSAVLRQHDTTERFVGAGTVGGWRSKLTEDEVATVERASHESLRRLGYPTPEPAP
ncbi:MAG TPA: sulfotransferase domain-containing protein [Actinomycetota bacterium]